MEALHDFFLFKGKSWFIMVRFRISTVIHKPADVVARALNNAENAPYWTTDLVKFEVIKGGPDMVGSVGHLHYLQKGRSYILVDKLIYCEPGKKYISEVEGEAISARVETTLNDQGGKTEMDLVWEGKGRNLALKVLLPLLKGRMIRQSKKELETFRELVETRGSDFKVL